MTHGRMIEKFHHALCIGFMAGTLAACGSSSPDSEDAVVTQVDAATAIDGFNLALGKVGGLVGKSTGTRALRTTPSSHGTVGALDLTSWGADWTDEDKAYFDQFGSGSTYDVAKNFYINMLDPTFRGFNGTSYFDVTIFGKVKNTVALGCALATLLEKDADGLIAVGDQSVTFASGDYEKIADCGVSASDFESLQGYTLNATVSATTDTTYYDRKITFPSFNPSYSTETILLRTTSAEVNVADTQTPTGSGLERVLLRYDIGQQKIYMEVMSGAGTSEEGMTDGSLWFYRLAFDLADDLVRHSFYKGNLTDSTTQSMKFTVVGKPSTEGTTVAFSAYSNYGNGGSLNSGVRGDCIDREDQTISTPGTLACTETGLAVDDEDLEAVLTDLRTSDGTTARADFSGFDGIAEDQTVPFDMDTVFTALVEHP